MSPFSRDRRPTRARFQRHTAWWLASVAVIAVACGSSGDDEPGDGGGGGDGGDGGTGAVSGSSGQSAGGTSAGQAGATDEAGASGAGRDPTGASGASGSGGSGGQGGEPDDGVRVPHDDTDLPEATGNTRLVIDAPGVLANDEGRSLRAVAGTGTTSAGGLVRVEADGAFVYLPPAGAREIEDTFEYRLDAPGNPAALVTLHVGSHLAWYVAPELRAMPGDGRDRFQDEDFGLDTLAELAGKDLRAGDLVVVRRAVASSPASALDSQVVLPLGVALAGEGISLPDPVRFPPAQFPAMNLAHVVIDGDVERPTVIVNSMDNALVLLGDNVVAGLEVRTPALYTAIVASHSTGRSLLDTVRVDGGSRGLYIFNSVNDAAITVRRSTFTNLSGEGIFAFSQGDVSVELHVEDDSRFEGPLLEGVHATARGSSQLDLTISDSSLQGTTTNDKAAIVLEAVESAELRFEIAGNELTEHAWYGIFLECGGAGAPLAHGTIRDNRIGTAGVADSGSIRVEDFTAFVGGDCDAALDIRDNQFLGSESGVFLGNGGFSSMSLRFSGNLVSAPESRFYRPLTIQSGSRACVQIEDNELARSLGTLSSLQVETIAAGSVLSVARGTSAATNPRQALIDLNPDTPSDAVAVEPAPGSMIELTADDCLPNPAFSRP